jgi:hypothetical protein
MSVRANPPATPTSWPFDVTVTCRPALAPGFAALHVSGLPLQARSDGMAHVLPVVNLLFDMAHGSHLSSRALALRLPDA